MNRFDTLKGGTVARLEKMRRYRDAWNAKADSGERRYSMRTKLAPGLAGALEARGHGIGRWNSDAHGIGDQLQRARAERKGYVSAPWELVDGWRDVGDSGDIVSLRHNGWYSDADCSETYRGHVWQLPARDGEPRYVAGYVEDQGGRDGTRAGGYVMLECNGGALALYDDKEDAARAGDALAERMAEDAREYSERWQEASDADRDRDDARETLRTAHASARQHVAALRELPAVASDGADGYSVARAKLRDGLESARDDMRAALSTIERCGDRIESLNMKGEF